METRLRQLAVLGNEIREGNLLALGQGALLVDPPRPGEPDRVREGRARILGGGVSLVSRPVALVMKPDYQSVRYTSQVAAAINLRFHVFTDGIKNGVARPKDDKYIELVVHPRYKDNIDRYMQVVRSVPLKESATERMDRLNLLERQLLDPVTAQNAALRLEAIGRDGLKALRKGAQSPDKEVRFYAAEALAYLDDASAAEPLARAVREEPAFRVYALAALSAMDDVAAYDQLCELLHAPSAETRYGAFRALWEMNPHDALVRGEQLGEQFSYHVLDTSGPAMVHATRSRRPELVLFGRHEKLRPPLMFEAGKVMINAAAGSEEVTIARFAIGQPDQRRIVPRRLDDVIRAAVELGATYPDVVHLLEQAKAAGALQCRFAVDALPEAGRSYRRGGQPPVSEETDAAETAAAGELDLEAGKGGMIEDPAAVELPEGGLAAGKEEPARPADDQGGAAGVAAAGQKRKKAPSLWGAFAKIRGQD